MQRAALNAEVVDEVTNPAAALNDQLKGNGEAGLVASSTTSNPKIQLERGNSWRFRHVTVKQHTKKIKRMIN